MTPLKELIAAFLEKFATEVRKDEDDAYIELMLDNHFCIEYENRLFYIPEDNSLYTDEDELLCEMLKCTFPLKSPASHLVGSGWGRSIIGISTDVDAFEYLDKNGNVIRVGDTVDAPDPDDSDIYNFAFRGTIVAFRYEYAIVADQDGNEFEIETNRLELVFKILY